jgi:hypothetical protein
LLLFVFGAENASSARARVVLCVFSVWWSSVEEESAGGVCVFYDVKPLCEREKSFFFLFFFSKKAPKSAKALQMAEHGKRKK